MCRAHFRVSVGVLHAHGEEAIGDDTYHVALRLKFCPKIVPSVSGWVFSTAAATFVLTENELLRKC